MLTVRLDRRQREDVLLPRQPGNHLNPTRSLAWRQVYLYKLTDQGKREQVELAVDSQGRITIDALAVNLCSLQGSPRQTHHDLGEKASISMTKVSTAVPCHWTKTGTQPAHKSLSLKGPNEMLRIEGSRNASPKLTDLKPNTRYTVYVEVDNRSNAKADITIKSGGQTISNYTHKSIARTMFKRTPTTPCLG